MQPRDPDPEVDPRYRCCLHERMERDESPSDDHSGPPRRPTFVQRQALKGLIKQARKRPDEPLSPADWESYWRFASQRGTLAFKRVLRAMPSSPRCGYCGAPFAGVGARVVCPLGYRPSRKNPNLCAVCVELAPSLPRDRRRCAIRRPERAVRDLLAE